jgi:hypothetical protein
MSSILDTYKNELQPAILPDKVPFEVLTPGWYILAAILILVAVILLIIIFRRWLKRKYRRQAHRLLAAEIKPMLLSTSQRQKGLANLSSLLKAVAIQSFSHERVAELYGVEWISFLSSTCKRSDFTSLQTVNLIDSQYQPNEKLATTEVAEIERLIELSNKWIGGHRV